MKEKKLYVCEFCRTEYNESDKAIACEKHHQKPVKVRALKYIPFNNDRIPAPLEVCVTTKDGEEYIYRRTSR